jgi:hypothetical protein
MVYPPRAAASSRAAPDPAQHPRGPADFETAADGVVLPLHGVPARHLHLVYDLLDEARRLRSLGRAPADVRRSLLQLARNLGPAVPLFSAGGLMEFLETVLAEKGDRR